MKKLIIILSILKYSLFCEQNINIFDKISKKSIPYVNVIYYNNNKIVGGDYCDLDGKLEIKLTNIEKLEFSSIAFEKLFIDFSKNIDTIFLTPKEYVLDEVIVVNNNNKTVNLGLINSNKELNLGTRKGLEHVVYIENIYNKSLNIKSFLFKIKKNRSKIALKVHFYKLNKLKFEPDEEIISKEIISYIDKNSQQLIEIDLLDYGLELPLDGAFIGIEILGVVNIVNNSFEKEINYSDDIIKLDVNYSHNKSISFIRNRFNNGKWDNSEYLKPLFHIKSNNYPNFSFGIKVFEKDL